MNFFSSALVAQWIERVVPVHKAVGPIPTESTLLLLFYPGYFRYFLKRFSVFFVRCEGECCLDHGAAEADIDADGSRRAGSEFAGNTLERVFCCRISE